MKTTVFNKFAETYNDRGIWEQWHNVEFSDYTEDFYREQVEKLCFDESDQNILLYGKNGNGKTMLMNLAMKKLFQAGYEVYVIDFRHLMKEYIRSWKDDNTKIARFLTVDYLAIDDLGKEFKAEGVSAELANATIDYILRYRVQRNKPTWLTFNMTLNEIKQTYNGHVASLLKRNTTAIEFTGADYGDKQFTKITKKK